MAGVADDTAPCQFKFVHDNVVAGDKGAMQHLMIGGDFKRAVVIAETDDAFRQWLLEEVERLPTQTVDHEGQTVDDQAFVAVVMTAEDQIGAPLLERPAQPGG